MMACEQSFCLQDGPEEPEDFLNFLEVAMTTLLGLVKGPSQAPPGAASGLTSALLECELPCSRFLCLHCIACSQVSHLYSLYPVNHPTVHCHYRCSVALVFYLLCVVASKVHARAAAVSVLTSHSSHPVTSVTSTPCFDTLACMQLEHMLESCKTLRWCWHTHQQLKLS